VRRFLLPALAAAALVAVGAVSADTGALPAPLAPDTTTPYTPVGDFLMQVTPFPWGAGWVRSSPYLIDCPFACIRPFDPGTVVTLQAFTTPTTPPWKFAGWEVANHGQPQLPNICAGRAPAR
jgi:hypothetical protein